MNQFDNPSSVAPFLAGFMLLTGMSTGKDGYNGLKFQYGEVPGPGQVPKFSDYQFFDATNPKAKPTSTVTQNGNYEGCVPYLFALDEQTLQVIYYGRENGSEGVFGHTFVWDGTSLKRIATAQLLVAVSSVKGTRLQPGAATIPGIPGVIVATQNIGQAGVNLTWCAPPSNPQTETYDLDTQLLTPAPLAPESTPFLLSLTVVVNTSSGTDESPFLGILLIGNPDPLYFMLAAFPLGLTNGVPNNVSSYAVTDSPIYESFLGLFRGADGVAYAQAEVDGGLGISPITFGPGSSSIQCDNWSQVTNSQNASQMAPVFYTFGTLDPNPSIGDTETVPVYRSIAWDSTHFQTDEVGQAKRTVFSETTDPEKSQGIVIGIIDSGPPVPNENVVSLPVNTLLGTTTFGVTKTSATGWTMASSLGGVFEFKTSGGIPKVFSVTQSMKISLGVTGGGSQQTQETEIQAFYSQSSTVAGQNGPVVSTQGGVALAYFPTYTCYRFDFLDASGNPVAGAAPYFELYPTGWVVRSLQFDYNPDAQSGIIPGELMSYTVDSDTLSALKSDMLNSTSSVELAWSTAGGELPQSSLLESGTKNIGTYLDFEYSIGGTFGDEVSSASVSAGVQAKFNFNYTWSQSTNDQIQTQLGLLAASAQHPNAYGNYTYDVYLLAHDQAYTQDLIELLQSYPTPSNQALLQVIAPGSVPWKMVHVLRAWEQVPAPAGQAADAMAEFLQRRPGWKPRGLKTTRPKAGGTSG